MKPKNNSEIAKRNRNNRKRGSQFEKYVADYLDMDVVPYSGSNSRFGYGDVRDSIWLGECKNITPDDNGNIIINRDWFIKNRERANSAGRKPFLAWMVKGKPHKYIILERKEYLELVDYMVRPHEEVSCGYVQGKRHLHININNSIVQFVNSDNITSIQLDGVNNKTWYMLLLSRFKHTIIKANMKGIRSGDQNDG